MDVYAWQGGARDVRRPLRGIAAPPRFVREFAGHASAPCSACRRVRPCPVGDFTDDARKRQQRSTLRMRATEAPCALHDAPSATVQVTRPDLAIVRPAERQPASRSGVTASRENPPIPLKSPTHLRALARSENSPKFPDRHLDQNSPRFRRFRILYQMARLQKARRDLFGRTKTKRKNRLQSAIEKYHRDTAASKVERLRWLNTVFPRGAAMFIGLESWIVFNEAKMTFLDGHFVGTMLLACSIVESVFADTLRRKGFEKESKNGLKKIIKCLRAHGLVDNLLLDKAEALRRKRNPFVHFQLGTLEPGAPPNPDSMLMRVLAPGTPNPFDLIDQDARDALSLMYQVLTRKGVTA
jgi:hypothetical protein